MQAEINKSPDELKGSQVGSNASKGKNEVVNYIEVVPSLPTFYMEDYEIAKILKMLFSPQSSL